MECSGLGSTNDQEGVPRDYKALKRPSCGPAHHQHCHGRLSWHCGLGFRGWRVGTSTIGCRILIASESNACYVVFCRVLW